MLQLLKGKLGFGLALGHHKPRRTDLVIELSGSDVMMEEAAILRVKDLMEVMITIYNKPGDPKNALSAFSYIARSFPKCTKLIWKYR